MKRLALVSLVLVTLAIVARAPVAQEGTPSAAAPSPVKAEEHQVDIITPHITDSHHLELPFAGEVELPRWAPVHIGSRAIDLSPTKHVVMLLLAAFLCGATMLTAAWSSTRETRTLGHARGFAGAIEAIVLYVRNEVVMKNVGPHGERFAPFVLTLFFFILFANLLGLIPYGSTATGNISVTATLAVITFVVIEGASMVKLGPGYIWTVLYWPHDMPIYMKLPMTLIMTPIEFISKLTKPFALAIRLFANMTAGHVVLLAMISLIFTFGSWFVAAGPVVMGVALSMLELFVAFLQAFIFALLASVFIGLGRQGAH
jgi:F-type H+-transporting ATPase subunit a